MTIDQFKNYQAASLKGFRELAKNNPSQAKDVALKNLANAGIVTKNGTISRHYK